MIPENERKSQVQKLLGLLGRVGDIQLVADGKKDIQVTGLDNDPKAISVSAGLFGENHSETLRQAHEEVGQAEAALRKAQAVVDAAKKKVKTIEREHFDTYKYGYEQIAAAVGAFKQHFHLKDEHCAFKATTRLDPKDDYYPRTIVTALQLRPKDLEHAISFMEDYIAKGKADHTPKGATLRGIRARSFTQHAAANAGGLYMNF